MYNEAIISFFTVVIGILSLIFSLKARSKLSTGSFKNYVNYYIGSLLFLVGFAVWKTVQSVFSLFSFKYIYTEYSLLALAFIVFAFATRKIFILSSEFGFVDKAEKINKVLKEKQKLKSKS